jgi:hypothetical protein
LAYNSRSNCSINFALGNSKCLGLKLIVEEHFQQMTRLGHVEIVVLQFLNDRQLARDVSLRVGRSLFVAGGSATGLSTTDAYVQSRSR